MQVSNFVTIGSIRAVHSKPRTALAWHVRDQRKIFLKLDAVSLRTFLFVSVFILLFFFWPFRRHMKHMHRENGGLEIF